MQKTERHPTGITAVRCNLAALRPCRTTSAFRTPHSAYAFTLVELVVVVIIVGLILAMAIPALNRMTQDAGFSAAVQSINAALTRAQIEAQADRTMTAVRFLPARWDAAPDGDKTVDPNRMHVSAYRYALQTTDPMADPRDPNAVTRVRFNEVFERAKENASVVLPPGIWAAPLEAIEPKPGDARLPSDRAEGILDGQLNTFEFDADDTVNSTEQLLEADDFLAVFDPATGLRNGAGHRPVRLHAPAPDPANQGTFIERDRNPTRLTELYKRFHFTGVVLYDREPYAALGGDADPEVRYTHLRHFGRPYFIHRSSATLIPAIRQTQ